MQTSAAAVGHPTRAAVHETHAGVVMLVGDRAYKVKKPVDLGFLDFTRPEVRAATCHAEVELNRRLAPDVYLGVGDLAQPDGGHEPVVVMRRMPEDRRLSTLVGQGADVRRDLRTLAHRLAGMHAASPHGPVIDAEGSPERLSARWTASFLQVRPFHRRVVDAAEVAEVERLTQRYLAGRAPLLTHRVDTGCIVDGHGDLIADDVFCLRDGPRALDCLEFDDRLRYVDRLDDAAFLAMDLERLGAADLGAQFVAWYVGFAGDVAPPSLLHHYIAYRAFVRAKVACLQHDQGDDTADESARRLVSIAHRHLTEASVTLTLVGGAPGTGKSTLSGALADRFAMVSLSTDRIRKELAGLDPLAPAPSTYREGLYTPERTRATYDEVLRRAERLLGRGESVVLDATWSDPGLRSRARAVAASTSSDLVEVLCSTPAQVADSRLGGRAGGSDADPGVAAALRRDRARWPEATVVDTAGSRESALLDAAALFARTPTPAPRPTPPPTVSDVRAPRRASAGPERH